jgi:uncharacterized repeat protein (TIGR01451 family)
MKLRTTSILLGFASSGLLAQPIVDIGLFAGPVPNTLQVRLLPHGPFSAVLGSLTFTVRWPAASVATLGQETNSCPGAIPCSSLPVEVVGNYQYVTINSFGISALVDEGCPWVGNEEVMITTIPVLNSSDLSEFRIVNDAYTTAYNRDYFLSLSGLDRTGSIYAGGVINPGDGIVNCSRYLDADLDCDRQVAEDGVPFRTMLIQPGAIDAITDQSGRFSMALPPGNYTLTTYAEQYVHPFCPQSQVTAFTIVADSTVAINLADTSSAGVDLEVLAFSGAPRPGFVHGAYASVRNLSATMSGPVTLTLTFDPLLSISNATPSGTVAPNAITWQLGTIQPFATVGATVWLEVPPDPLLTGTILDYGASFSSTPDAHPLNDIANWSATIVNSLDPNDKLVSTSSRTSDTQYFLGMDTMLTYTIRFQNTGTAEAFEVVVTDTLSADLDMATFEQGVASHPFDVSFKPGRVVEWRFADIVLPDSTTNEPESHGLVQFHIKPQASLLPGTVISNVADIFFDMNPPVPTPPAVVVVQSPMDISETIATDALLLYPQPASDRVYVQGAMANSTYHLLQGDGRLMRSGPFDQNGIDLSGLSAGTYLMVVIDPHGGADHARFVKR